MASPLATAIQAAIVTDITDGGDRETTRAAVNNWLEKSKADTASAKFQVITEADQLLRDQDTSQVARAAIESLLKGLTGGK
jgi:hypothetical protein